MSTSLPFKRNAYVSAVSSLLISGLSAVAMPLQAAELVVNGSFEQPAIPYLSWKLSSTLSGWKLGAESKGNRFELQNNVAGAPQAKLGNQFAELDSNGTTLIYQDIPTTPGTVYQLRFHFSARPGVVDNQLQVKWGGTVVGNIKASGFLKFNTVWKDYTYSVTATGTTTRLSFSNLGEVSDSFGAYLDGVSVVPADTTTAQNSTKLAILLPDINAGSTPTDALSTPAAQAWLDAIKEEGFNVEVIRDSQFASVAGKYKAVILPDAVHQIASEQLLSDISAYVKDQGGNVLIVYDFGALNTQGLFPTSGPNPFSNLVGVDYNLYGELYGQTTLSPVGLGPIYGMESTLWKMQVPPGKYMTWPTEGSATFTMASTSEIATATDPENTPTAYLKTDSKDPGGVRKFDAGYIHRIPFGHEKGITPDQIFAAQSEKIPHSALIGKRPNRHKQNPVPYSPDDSLQGVSSYLYGFLTYPTYVTCNLGHTSSASDIANFDSNCTTTGESYTGNPLLVSDRFGLVAGHASRGNGNVMFVNLPLSRLKTQTDGLLMHGAIRYFGDDLSQLPRLASVPNGIPGMTVNVHVDSQDALAPINEMKAAGIWDNGPFSVHFTGGPVVDYQECLADSNGLPIRSLPVNGQPATCANLIANPLGDVVYQKDVNGNKIVKSTAAVGLNIPNNSAAKAAIQYFAAKGHQIGAHGGWLHDYYGNNAHDDIYDLSTTPSTLVNPSNQATYQPYLELNKTTVDKVVARKTTEYSAPMGNNSKWAVNWLENNGVLGAYFLGDTGMGATRHWREGDLLNQSIWMFPVTPLGLYATFEEFTEYGVDTADVTNWLTKLVDFEVVNRTNRLVYFHPPGAVDYLPSLQSMIDRADSYANSSNHDFKWYSMTDIAKFMTNRKQVSWSVTPQSGKLLFQASHPSSLVGQTWILPKEEYNKPTVNSTYNYWTLWGYKPSATVSEDGEAWLVTVNSGTSISFTVSAK
ncbi:MAG: hypothetical protein Q8N35_01945 [Methylococcaceae bacterium]|nr:hypothetical protein [Methylococcaceae bacterium]MDZ4156742.1 hypothetical protein [Methylococcales bacterium]MDP2393354.1 hypothetical protein [Methylococcaceae bacterium]MDP3018325.1 hypothetical protein [Methylococcaceae bacterium]MDP3388543.1 hypothetical protein [Methylococcaceae bacterium]